MNITNTVEEYCEFRYTSDTSDLLSQYPYKYGALLGIVEVINGFLTEEQKIQIINRIEGMRKMAA